FFHVCHGERCTRKPATEGEWNHLCIFSAFVPCSRNAYKLVGIPHPLRGIRDFKKCYRLATCWFAAKVPTNALRLSCSSQVSFRSLPLYALLTATAGMACVVFVSGG